MIRVVSLITSCACADTPRRFQIFIETFVIADNHRELCHNRCLLMYNWIEMKIIPSIRRGWIEIRSESRKRWRECWGMLRDIKWRSRKETAAIIYSRHLLVCPTSEWWIFFLSRSLELTIFVISSRRFSTVLLQAKRRVYRWGGPSIHYELNVFQLCDFYLCVNIQRTHHEFVLSCNSNPMLRFAALPHD